MVDDMMKLKERAKQLKTDIPAVFIAIKRRETPFAAKIFAALTIAYALSPIDLIPDFILILGYLDDLLILPAMVWATVKLIPDDIFQQCRRESAEMWKNGKPKKWYFALPIVLIWLIVIWIIVRLFFM